MIDAQDMEILKHVLIVDEGMKLFPYVDCCGKGWKQCQCAGDKKGFLTIGVGRNLDTKGLSEKEAHFLLDNDVKDSILEVERNFGTWFKKLIFPRQMVIISMAFNMGLNGLKTFQKMIKCISSGDFASASNQMLNSKWSSQVGKRAVRLAETMRSGTIQG